MQDINHIHATLDDLFTCNDCNHLFVCQSCGSSLENDLLAQFTSHKVCLKCVNKKHKKVVKG